MMERLLKDIRQIIEQGRTLAVRSVNQSLTLMYWNIGRVILEEEQNGKERAGYKDYLLKKLSEKLVLEYGEGFSRRQLELFRQLYSTFPIANALSSQLTWTHYKSLVRIDDVHKRDFYIAETTKNAWSVHSARPHPRKRFWERTGSSVLRACVLPG